MDTLNVRFDVDVLSRARLATDALENAPEFTSTCLFATAFKEARGADLVSTGTCTATAYVGEERELWEPANSVDRMALKGMVKMFDQQRDEELREHFPLEITFRRTV